MAASSHVNREMVRAYVGQAFGAAQRKITPRQFDRKTVSGTMGVISKTAAPGQLLDEALAWAALVPPDCYPAYAFAKRALQATWR